MSWRRPATKLMDVRKHITGDDIASYLVRYIFGVMIRILILCFQLGEKGGERLGDEDLKH